MANNYTHTVGGQVLRATKEGHQKLVDLMEEDEDRWHGMTASLYLRGPEDEEGELHIHSEETGIIEEVPQAALNYLGDIIGNNGLDYMTFGVAWTCDKQRPGEFGGMEIRLWKDGSLEFPYQMWPTEHPHEEIYNRTKDDLVTIYEAARVALSDANIFDALARAMDLSDVELRRVNKKLIEVLSDSDVVEKVGEELD